MQSLIKEFKLRTVSKKDKLYINRNDIKNKLHISNLSKLIDKKYVIYEEINKDEDDLDNLTVEMFILSSQVKNILEKINSHPEHYNAHKILDIEKNYHKKDEIEILAEIYKYFRHEYNIIYQYPFLEFKLDVCIVIEISSYGGIVIEIDENGHNTYDSKSNEERQIILESCGFHFIRINPTKYDKNEILDKVKKEIREYELIHTIDIEPDALWKELQNKSIDKDFFNFIGKSIVCNKKYCVDFDDVLKYLDYSQKHSAKKLLTDKFKNSVDYVILTQKELKIRTDIFYSTVHESKKGSGGHNKEYIFLTKFAFYTFALLSQTRKGKQIRMWIVDIYTKYQEILIFTRTKLINMKKDVTKNNADKLYKQRNEEKFKRTVLNNNRKVKELKIDLDDAKNEKNTLKNIVSEQKTELDNYRNIYNENIQEDKKIQSKLKRIYKNEEIIKHLTETLVITNNMKLKKKIADLIKDLIIMNKN